MELGINGLLGLGFPGKRASNVDGAIREKYGDSATWGQPWIHNVFASNTTTPNFIAFDLARSDDLEDITGGTFDIGVYDPRYVAIQNAPKLPVFPPGEHSWQTLLDGIKVAGKDIPLVSGVTGAPKGKAVTVLDTGAPTSLFPNKMVNAIYESVPEAVYDSRLGWILPCYATTVVEFFFAYVPVHVYNSNTYSLEQRAKLPDAPARLEYADNTYD